MFFCITQTELKSALNHTQLDEYSGLKIDSTKNISQTSFSPNNPKKQKHSNHTRCIFYWEYRSIFMFCKNNQKSSNCTRGHIDSHSTFVGGRLPPPPGIALFYFFERCLLSTTCGTSIFFAATVICCHRLCEWQDLVVGWDFSFFVDAVVKLCRCKSGNASDPVSQALLQPWRVEIHWNPISIMALSAWEPSLGKEHQLETTTGLFTSRPSLYSCGHPFSPCYV